MLKNQKGQSIIEYSTIVSLIALVAMLALAILGNRTRDVFSETQTQVFNTRNIDAVTGTAFARGDAQRVRGERAQQEPITSSGFMTTQGQTRQ